MNLVFLLVKHDMVLLEDVLVLRIVGPSLLEGLELAGAAAVRAGRHTHPVLLLSPSGPV